MKKNLLSSIYSLLITAIFLLGCQKETRELANTETETESLARGGGGNNNECRLTAFEAPGYIETYHYNQRGLCDEWIVPDFATFKQEYDHKGRLKISRMYVENELFATVHFFYTGKKVTKEIWYYGDTDEIYDEVHYFFNHRGQNVRMESAVYDYHTINSFDAHGNCKAYEFYSDGNHVYSMRATYNYRPFFKNPRRAIPGIEYGFPFLNAAVFESPECISSEKLTTFDESGNPVLLYDYDPRKTSYRRALQNYPSSGRFFDRVANEWTSQAFQYENCRGQEDCEEDISTPTMAGQNKNATPLIMRPAIKELITRMKIRRNK